MMTEKRPRLLDLFCKAGGAGAGYHQAGFDVVGVDIERQPNYPFEFHQSDALEFLERHGLNFDAIHASPPCQAYTLMRHLGKTAGKNAPDLIAPVRNLLNNLRGQPWIIENVIGSPLIHPVLLCGTMFNLGVRRHRLFESNALLMTLECNHGASWPIPVWGDGRPSRQEARKKHRPIAVYGEHPQGKNDKTYRCNRAKTLAEASQAMGIDWMTWKEITQAVPPAYTKFLGEQLIAILKALRRPRDHYASAAEVERNVAFGSEINSNAL
jgi:DNA (cytosine-5)-methyltransferase 1